MGFQKRQEEKIKQKQIKKAKKKPHSKQFQKNTLFYIKTPRLPRACTLSLRARREKNSFSVPMVFLRVGSPQNRGRKKKVQKKKSGFFFEKT